MCRDHEYCGNIADPQYTMDFTEVEPGAYIHWCSSCGPLWAEVNEALTEKLDEDPVFKEKFEKALIEHIIPTSP